MLYKLRTALIVCAVILVVAIGIICAMILGFKPTETHAYGRSEILSGSSSVFSENVSSEASSVTESPSSTGSSVVSSSTAASSETSTSEPVTPTAENNPRLGELQQRLTYGEHWKLLLSENQKQLAADSLFVGDSICMGFAAYGLVDWKNVYAAGSVGARNFFDSDIKYYGEIKPYNEVLAEKDPKRVFTWMGMNDVNVTSAAVYAENYKKIIDYTLANSEAEVIVFAMTPVNSDFTPNERIIENNAALKAMIKDSYIERVKFVDFAYVFTDSFGKLCEDYDSGDGVHLVPDVYYLAMIEICDQLGLPA